VKLGMNMLLRGADVSGGEYDATYAMLKEAGCEGVEVPIFDREVDKYAELGARLDGLGLERLAVAARFADESPISEDPAVRAEASAGGAVRGGARRDDRARVSEPIRDVPHEYRRGSRGARP
jgi:sugar phosphate isomerase/epimerase